MNSLVSETKVVCNDAIPNPITPVLVPIKITDDSKSITVLNGTHLKLEKTVKDIINKQETNNKEKNDNENNKESAKEDSMNTDNSIESNISAMEPMDCNSTPNISPAHVGKCNSSNEDVAMSEASVRKPKYSKEIYIIYNLILQNFSGSMQVEVPDTGTMLIEPNEHKYVYFNCFTT